jgi:uncharacterized OB-fold protein
MSAGAWKVFREGNLPDSAKNTSSNKTGSVVPVQVGLFNYPLTDGERAVLKGNRCTQCGKTFFPKRAVCPVCFVSGNVEEIELERQGVVYASTVVRVSSPTGIKAPYAYGYVDLPANQLRVFALFTGADPDSFVPGRKVEVVLEPVGKDTEGNTVIGYKFKPVTE